MSTPQDISGIGAKPIQPLAPDPTRREDIGGKSRPNTGEWNPFVDWMEVFPGNRGVNRHGFYDLYDAPLGVKLEVEEGLESEPLIVAEEGGAVHPYGLWKADGQYHMIYGGYSSAGSKQHYAFSDDGYNWTLPKLGQVEVNGSKKNNMLAEPPAGGPGFFIDPTAPPEERYRYMIQEGGGFDAETGEILTDEEWQKRRRAQDYEGSNYQGPRMVFRHWVSGFTSPDGINWTRMEQHLAEFPADGGIAPGYDPDTDQYFAYTRPTGVGRRAIALTKTKDFLHWPFPRLIMFTDPQDEPDVSFYGVNYFRYPGRNDLHGMFVQVYHQIADSIDNQLAVSHDGLFWYRHRKPIIPLGPTGSGYECMNRSWGSNLTELPDGYWATLHEGVSSLHNFSQRATHNPFPAKQAGQIRWARWQPHRLCGIEAEIEGRLTIQNIMLFANELRLNYRCKPGGWVKAELIRVIPSRMNPDAEGVPGFTFEECERLTGDSLDKAVTWQGKSDISGVGKTMAIRLKMFQAKLFAYQC